MKSQNSYKKKAAAKTKARKSSSRIETAQPARRTAANRVVNEEASQFGQSMAALFFRESEVEL